MNMTVGANQSIDEASISAVVIRCGCGDPLTIHAQLGGGQIGPCPTPRTTNDLGMISYWNKSRFKRAAWAAKQRIKEHR